MEIKKSNGSGNMWSGAELGRLLLDLAGYKLSAPSISALINEQPKQVKIETMDALCIALECTPSDLWLFTTTPYVKKKQEKIMPMEMVLLKEYLLLREGFPNHEANRHFFIRRNRGDYHPD